MNKKAIKFTFVFNFGKSVTARAMSQELSGIIPEILPMISVKAPGRLS